VFQKARQAKYAIGAFNAGTFETIRAIIGTANALRSPIILETSSGETDYFGIETLVAIVRSLTKRSTVPVLLNLDHAHDVRLVRKAIALGFDIVHYDGSLLTPEKNAAKLRSLVPFAHAHGVLVEGEREHIAGNSTLHQKARLTFDRASFTDPNIARAFVLNTGIDTLAVSVGEAHGLYQGVKKIDIARIREIRKATPAFLSLHGGSGVPARDVRAAISAGITKVNINTELRVELAAGLRRALRHSSQIVPYDYLPPVIKSIAGVVEKKIRLFGSAGKG
jgi:fructose-bisphosphate aldolase class II